MRGTGAIQCTRVVCSVAAAHCKGTDKCNVWLVPGNCTHASFLFNPIPAVCGFKLNIIIAPDLTVRSGHCIAQKGGGGALQASTVPGSISRSHCRMWLPACIAVTPESSSR